MLHNTRKRGDAAVSQTADWLNLAPAQVRTAVRYYSEFPQEIDERIRRNQEDSAAAEAIWKREQASAHTASPKAGLPASS